MLICLGSLCALLGSEPLPRRAALCRWRHGAHSARIASFANMEGQMKRYLLTIFILLTSAAAFAQDARIPSNRELVARARSYYVDSDSFYMKREALESSLLGQAEFKAWQLQVTNRADLADMIVHVKRVPFSNHFSYTVRDRATDTIVMAGKVDSLSGTVYGLIAKEIVEKMVALRGDPLPHDSTKKENEQSQ